METDVEHWILKLGAEAQLDLLLWKDHIHLVPIVETQAQLCRSVIVRNDRLVSN